MAHTYDKVAGSVCHCRDTSGLYTNREVVGRKLDKTVLIGWPPDTDFSSGSFV